MDAHLPGKNAQEFDGVTANALRVNCKYQLEAAANRGWRLFFFRQVEINTRNDDKRMPVMASREHPKCSDLSYCDACGRYHDRELFDRPYDTQCMVATRKQERIRQGLINYENPTSSGLKSHHACMRVAAGEFDRLMGEWKARRRAELTAAGVSGWKHYSILVAEAPEAKQRILAGMSV